MSNWLSRSTVVNFRFWVKSDSQPYRDQVKDAGTWRKLTDYFVKCGWDLLYFVISSFTFHVYMYHVFANSVHIPNLFVVYTNNFYSKERDKVNFYVDSFRWKICISLKHVQSIKFIITSFTLLLVKQGIINFMF